MTPYPGAATPGTMTPGFATSSRLDLNQIGEARNSILGIKLDQVRMRSGSHVASLDPGLSRPDFIPLRDEIWARKAWIEARN